jgi:hypothetical protein
MESKYVDFDTSHVKSDRLKKYGKVYNSYIRKIEESKIKNLSTYKSKKSNKKPKSLNLYQKFVRCESKKDKYKNLSSKQRLTSIANEWKQRKKV